MSGGTTDLAILTGYSQDPMYFDAQDGELTNHTIDEAAEFFGLSEELTRELHEWDDEYQDTLDMAVPQDSRFASEEVFLAWLEKGRKLAVRIKEESSRVGVIDYQGNGRYLNGECLI